MNFVRTFLDGSVAVIRVIVEERNERKSGLSIFSTYLLTEFDN